MQDLLEIEFNKTILILKTVPQQPIDLYLDFDPDYFIKKEDEQHVAAAYHELLQANRTTLNDVINNTAKPKDLPPKFYAELTRIAHQEKTPVIEPLGSLKSTDFLKKIGTELNQKQHACVAGRIFHHLLRCLYPMYYPTQREHEIPVYRKFPKHVRDEIGTSDILKYLTTEKARKIGFDKKLLKKNPRNNICTIFACDYIDYIQTQVLETMRDIRDIIDVIGAEGSGSDMFWTLAPYINVDMQQRGNMPGRSMDKLFRWIRCAHEEAHRTGDDFSRNYFPATLFAKIGVYQIKEPLGYDERMPTHLRARLLSKIVAEELD